MDVLSDINIIVGHNNYISFLDISISLSKFTHIKWIEKKYLNRKDLWQIHVVQVSTHKVILVEPTYPPYHFVRV